ncbi:hypothetical protein [Acinetobacter modestus]|uniref:hypothetical protein n=1 Tax=Acinetobacter modestus TaxID=1776740 RepID=UPI00320AC186
MKKLMVLTTVFSVVGFSGCSIAKITHGETKPHVSFVNLSNPNSNVTDGSTIYVWSPKNNAAVINKEGKGCIQGADVFHNEDVSVSVSNKLLEIVSGVATSPNVTADDKLAAINTVSKIVQLKTNTERTSYLSIGMFGLCQLYSNGKLNETELKELVEKLITESVNIVPKSENSVPFAPIQNSIPVEEPKK